jgi:hypothetical protein
MERTLRVVAAVSLGFSLGVLASVQRLPIDEQIIDSRVYVALAEDLAGADGYSDGILDHVRYPPGVPLMVVPFVWAGQPELFSLFALWALAVAVFLTAWRMQGPVAASVAVLLVSIVPHMERMGGFVMSDGITAAFTVLAVLAWHEGREGWAGALIGWTIFLRFSGIALIGAGCLVAGRRFARAALPFVLALLLFWSVAPFGPAGGELGWSLDHLWSGDGLRSDEHSPLLPNLLAHPQIVLGIREGPGAAMLPFVGLLGLFELLRRRSWFALAMVGSTIVVYQPYFSQAQRLLLPATVILNLYAGIALDRLLGIGAPTHEVAPATSP